MTTTRELSVTFTIQIKEEEPALQLIELTGSETEEDIRGQIAEEYNDLKEDDQEDITPDDVKLIKVETDESIGSYETLENIFEFAEAYSECDQDVEVVLAALECGVHGSDIDEAYQGQYDSDGKFVEDLLEQTGDLPKLPSYVHIDWERTSTDIMMDYCEDNGHYFRNL